MKKFIKIIKVIGFYILGFIVFKAMSENILNDLLSFSATKDSTVLFLSSFIGLLGSLYIVGEGQYKKLGYSIIIGIVIGGVVKLIFN